MTKNFPFNRKPCLEDVSTFYGTCFQWNRLLCCWNGSGNSTHYGSKKSPGIFGRD